MNEFSHYGHKTRKDMENCSACILLHSGEEGPNYAAWPLSFISSGRAIPKKYYKALVNELKSENMLYVKNLEKRLQGTGLENFIEIAKKELGLTDSQRMKKYHLDNISRRLKYIQNSQEINSFHLDDIRKNLSELEKLQNSENE